MLERRIALEFLSSLPPTYPQSFLNIVAPAGTPLLLDEQPLMGTPEVVSGHDVYTLPRVRLF